MLGACLTGKVADRFGRKPALLFSTFFSFVTAIGFAFTDHHVTMGIVRALYGLSAGFSLPLTTSMVAEITPLKYRGKSLVIISLAVTLGKLFSCLLAYIFLN